MNSPPSSPHSSLFYLLISAWSIFNFQSTKDWSNTSRHHWSFIQVWRQTTDSFQRYHSQLLYCICLLIHHWVYLLKTTTKGSQTSFLIHEKDFYSLWIWSQRGESDSIQSNVTLIISECQVRCDLHDLNFHWIIQHNGSASIQSVTTLVYSRCLHFLVEVNVSWFVVSVLLMGSLLDLWFVDFVMICHFTTTIHHYNYTDSTQRAAGASYSNNF